MRFRKDYATTKLGWRLSIAWFVIMMLIAGLMLLGGLDAGDKAGAWTVLPVFALMAVTVPFSTWRARLRKVGGELTAGNSKRADRRLPIDQVAGIGVGRVDHPFLFLRWDAPIFKMADGEMRPYHPFAAYWLGRNPSKGSQCRAEQLAGWVGVPYLGVLKY